MPEVGLIELFRPKSSWYLLSSKEKTAFFDRVKLSIEKAQSKGCKLHGPFKCRWSSEWDMFAFWEAPSIDVAQSLAQDAEELGWFEFFEQTNLIGSKRTSEEYAEQIIKH